MLDGIQISVGHAVAARFGCISFRFIFILVFIFLSLPLRFYSLLLLCLWWAAKKFYYCNGKSAMKMRSAILLSFSLHSSFLLQPEFSLGFPIVFLLPFFIFVLCILIKTRSNKIPAVFTWLENDFPWRRAWKIVGTTKYFFFYFFRFIFAWKVWKAKEKPLNIRKNDCFLLAARGRLKRYCTACNCQHVEAREGRGRVHGRGTCGNCEWSCNFYGQSINFHYFNACFMRAETQKLKNCSSSGSTIFAGYLWAPSQAFPPRPTACHTMLNPQIYDACGQFGTYGNCPSTLWGSIGSPFGGLML